MKNIILLMALGLFFSCSKTEKTGLDEDELNKSYLQNNPFVSNEYEYTDPGVKVGDVYVIQPSQKKRHNVIHFNPNGKYKFYYSPNGDVGFPYEDDAIELPYILDYPNITIEGKTISTQKNASGDLYFVLDGNTYTVLRFY